MVNSGSFSENESSTCHPEIAIVGIGNILLSDDGVGVHLVHRLAGKIDRDDVALIDAGTSPELFFLTHGGVRKLIVIDAVQGNEPPGSVYRFGLDDLEMQNKLPVSLHDLTLLDNLRSLELLGRKPESVVIIGVEPKATEFGTKLSPEVEEALPKVIELVLKELKSSQSSLRR